jgi:hypothetical protein
MILLAMKEPKTTGRRPYHESSRPACYVNCYVIFRFDPGSI